MFELNLAFCNLNYENNSTKYKTSVGTSLVLKCDVFLAFKRVSH